MTVARARAMRPVTSLCMVLSWSLEAATSKERQISEDKVVTVCGTGKILKGSQG